MALQICPKVIPETDIKKKNKTDHTAVHIKKSKETSSEVKGITNKMQEIPVGNI